jgi:hypothetical protein
MREEHRLRVLRISGPKRGGSWRRLHNEEFCTLYASLNIIRVIKSRKVIWHVTPMGEMRNAYNILVGKSEVRRPLVRPRHK